MQFDEENIAQSLAREMKAPVVLKDEDHRATVALPEGWTVQMLDREELLAQPRRIKTHATLDTKGAFIDYVTRHAEESTIWVKADLASLKVGFAAILDDHFAPEAGLDDLASWRSHRAGFCPQLSVEWDRWLGNNGKSMDQMVFAAFLEDNLKDIAGDSGFPDGGKMLAMALDFQAKQDSSFKSAIRQQSGSVRMEFVKADTAQTVESMQVFERFRVAIPVFRDDTVRYPIEARLCYRVRDGKLSFWYELIRADLVFEQSASALIEFIKAGCALPFFYGNPG